MQMKLKSGPFKGMEVKIAEQDVVDQYPELVDEILDCIGIGGAFVTDMTELSDFSIGDPDERAEMLANVRERFGLELTSAHITFPVLIEKIRRLRETQTPQ